MTTLTTETVTPPDGGAHGNPPTSHRRRWLIGSVLVVAALAAAGTVHALGSDDGVPYRDARSSGTITLCDGAGKPVTSGSTTAAPFVALAVGTTAAPATATTTLFAFQPREGTGAGEWSGQQLTAASTFTEPAHPMAQATAADIALGDFLQAFPARWDGLVQLRLYVTSPETGIAGKYDTVDLRVDGDRWSVVGTPGTGGCRSGTATSSETALLDSRPATS